MKIDYHGGTNPVLEFRAKSLRSEKQLELEVMHLIHGGNTQRSRQKEIKRGRDLARWGKVHRYAPLGPVAFLVPTFNATTSHLIQMYDNANNAEVEYVVIIDQAAKIYASVGSDHTDRDLERTGGPPKSRLVAPKVVARDIWPYDEVKDHWHDLIMRAYVYRDDEPRLCQEETLKALLAVEDLIDITRRQTGLEDMRCSVLFGGTIPFLGRTFPRGRRWDLELFDPVLDRKIEHHYDVEVVWHRVPPYPTAERPPEM